MDAEASRPNAAAMEALQEAVKTLQDDLASLRQQVDSNKKPNSKRSKTSHVNANFQLPAEQNLFSKLPAEVRLKIWREVLASNLDIVFKCWPVYIRDSTQPKRGGKRPLSKWKLKSDSVPSEAPISCYNALKLVCQLCHSDQKSPSAFYKYNTFAARNIGAMNRLIHINSQANLESIRDLKLGDQESTLDRLWHHLHVSLLAFKGLRTFELTWNNVTRPQREWYKLADQVGKVVHSLPAFRRFVMVHPRLPRNPDTIVMDKEEGIEVKLTYQKYGHFDDPDHIRSRFSHMKLLYPIWRRLVKWEASDDDEPEIAERCQRDRVVVKLKTITATFSMDNPADTDETEADETDEKGNAEEAEDGEEAVTEESEEEAEENESAVGLDDMGMN